MLLTELKCKDLDYILPARILLWIRLIRCPLTDYLYLQSDAEEKPDGADLALANVGGVFFVLGVGIAIGVILAIFEFLWNVRSVSVEEHVSKGKLW